MSRFPFSCVSWSAAFVVATFLLAVMRTETVSDHVFAGRFCLWRFRLPLPLALPLPVVPPRSFRFRRFLLEVSASGGCFRQFVPVVFSSPNFPRQFCLSVLSPSGCFGYRLSRRPRAPASGSCVKFPRHRVPMFCSCFTVSPLPLTHDW